MKHHLEMHHVNFAYGHTEVLKDITLHYDTHEFLSIIGPNGGGKSTLLKLMIGLLEPRNGEIRLFGQLPLHVSHRIAYVPQETNTNKEFPITVLDVVLMGRLGLSSFAFYSKEDKKIAKEMLTKVGMEGLESHAINALSGGQRQRVFIARALATNAQILFLDEPTASIDTSGQLEIFKLLKTLNQEVGIVIISHDVNVALHYATRVIHVNKTIFEHEVTPHIQPRFIPNAHVCPVELISATRCNHIHPHQGTS